LESKGIPTKNFEIICVINNLVQQITEIKKTPFHLITLMIVFASGICIFVTTIDTWLIGIAQHLYIPEERNASDNTKLIITLIAIITMVISIIIINSDRSLFIVGIIGSLILFGNFGIIIFSVYIDQTQIAVMKYLKIYLLLTGTISMILIINLKNEIIYYVGNVAGTQFLCSLIILYLFPKRYGGSNEKSE